MNIRSLAAPAVAAALTLLAAVGCTDTKELPTSSISSSNVFSDTRSYQEFLGKIYASLALTGQLGQFGNADISCSDEGSCNYIRLWWEFEELPTDEAIISWNDGSLFQLNTQLLTPDNGFLYGMYYRIYFLVGMANEFLRQTTDAALASRGVSAALKTQIQAYRAEARFLRALAYWHALDIFGNVPLVTENDPLGATPPKQSDTTAIYNYVVGELTAIQGQLPAPSAATYGRATTMADQILLAHLYLNDSVYTGSTNWTAAMNAAAAVINSGIYSLDPNYRHLFEADNNTSPEIIFAIPQDGTNTQEYGGTTFLICASASGDMPNSGLGCTWAGWRLKPQADSLYNTTADHPAGDKRNSYFIQNANHTLAVADWSVFNEGVAAQKFTNLTSTGGTGSSNQFADTDFPMFRLGDAFLVYAEACLRSGGGTCATTALTLVDSLRARAYGSTAGNITAAQLTLPFILQERGRELLLEGYRRTDLRRYNEFVGGTYLWAYKGNDPAGKATDPTYNLFPIPRTELQVNPNLKQNNGYK